MMRGTSLVAAASTVAAALHFWAIGGHLRESAVEAALFFVAGLLQMAWAMAVGLGAGRQLLLTGVALNVGIAAVWALSRTVGMPFGAYAGEIEPAGPADVVATLAEAVVIVWSARVLLARSTSLPVAPG